jgi:Xaa-Pro aminopeptidase
MTNIRLSKIRKFVSGGRYTHIIVSDTCDVEYLTGFRSSNVHCVVSCRENLLCSDFRYREAALAFCRRNRGWKFLEIKENDFSFLKRVMGTRCVAGYQSNALTVDQFRLLRRACPGVRLVALPRSFGDVFVPKAAAEIECMRSAAAIGDKAFRDILRATRPGITEKRLAAFCEERCKKYGSERPSFDTIVLFGRRAALPHGTPSDTRLQRGDWVLCDFGCTVRGFASDMTRTFVLGRASVVQKKVYSVVLAAQKAARFGVRAGQPVRDVDKYARDVIAAAGYGPLFGHATGHGVGLRIHEKPRISASDKAILLQDSVITVEPGIYHPRFGGVRIEDMVVVREDGCEILTTSPRNLIEIGIA